MIAKKRRKTLALATVVGAAGFSTAGVALAGVTGTGMHVDPETVEPGGSYVIRNDPGSPCALGEVTGDTGGVRPGAWTATMESDGTWSVTIEVPESGPPDAMGNPTPFREGEYEQHAFCHEPLTPEATSAQAAGQQQEGFEYDPVTVTVTAPEEQEAAPEQEEEEPPAAEPAAEAPTFTG